MPAELAMPALGWGYAPSEMELRIPLVPVQPPLAWLWVASCDGALAWRHGMGTCCSKSNYLAFSLAGGELCVPAEKLVLPSPP